MIQGAVAYATTCLPSALAFHQFVRSPKVKISIAKYIQHLHIHISTAFDIRRMTKPNWLVKELRERNPSWNPNSSTYEWVEPYQRWRARLSEALKGNFIIFQKLSMESWVRCHSYLRLTMLIFI